MHMDIDQEPFSSRTLATAAAVAILIFAGCGFGAGYSWPHDPPAARSALDGKTASPGSSHSIHVADMMNDCSGCENPHYVLRAADRYKYINVDLPDDQLGVASSGGKCGILTLTVPLAPQPNPNFYYFQSWQPEPCKQ